MDMIPYLGKKVDITLKDGQRLSGYVADVLEAEDSDIGCDSFELFPIDRNYTIEVAMDDVEKVVVDKRYKEIDFRC